MSKVVSLFRDGSDPPEGSGGGGDALERIEWELTDYGFGLRFAAGMRDQAFYVPGRGWAVWQGSHFSFEGGDDAALWAASIVAEMLREEARAAGERPISDEQLAQEAARLGTHAAAARAIRDRRRAPFNAAARKSRSISKLRAARDLARHALRRNPRDLDTAQDLLQFPNGTLDLAGLEGPESSEETAEERAERIGRAFSADHDRDSRPTRVMGVEFDPTAAAPGFERFMRLAFPDEIERWYAQRALGAILGGQRSEFMLVLLGQGGNGKSTVTKALELALGSYAQACRIEMFCEQKGGGAAGHNAEEAVLPGARAYLASEPDIRVTLSASKVKGLTGGDLRMASAKGRDPFEFRPSGVPILSANKMPAINDPSEGFWRRVNPVLFQEKLHELPPDERLSSAEVERMLRSERAGIVQWLVDGWIEFRDFGLNPPPAVSALKGDLRALADPVGTFLAERCRTGEGLSIKTSALYERYCAFVQAQGDQPLGGRNFISQMLARDFQKVKRSVWHWIEIDIDPDAPLDAPADAGDDR